MAFEIRHNEFEALEYENEEDLLPPLDHSSIMILAHILVASETTGHLRDGRIINYLFKSVFELVESDD